MRSLRVKKYCEVRIALPALVFAAAICFSGCAMFDSYLVTSNAPSQEPVTSAPASVPDDFDKLAQLWQARAQERTGSDYPIGPGDVVEISVPAIEELRANVVRIAGDGTMTLPFIGRVQASGSTEEELRQKVLQRLKQYMYNPRAVLFVKEYRSRQVAVLGAVVRPGLYSLTRGADSLLDTLAQAGGIAVGAEQKIYLIPALPVENGTSKEVLSMLPKDLLQQDPTPLLLKRSEPIVIDIKQMAFGGTQRYLSLSLRPGDVIMVPSGGQVLVEGWVQRPGAYTLTPGLTLAGVIAQAGGQMFPADITALRVIRADKLAMKSFIFADLQKIKTGEAADIALQGGDIVQVSAEQSKLIAYGIYRFFSTVINVGVGGTVPIVK